MLDRTVIALGDTHREIQRKDSVLHPFDQPLLSLVHQTNVILDVILTPAGDRGQFLPCHAVVPHLLERPSKLDGLRWCAGDVFTERHKVSLAFIDVQHVGGDMCPAQFSVRQQPTFTADQIV